MTAITYVYPTIDRTTYDPMARRFAQSYLSHPPGDSPHSVHVLVNGPKYAGIEKVFDPVPVELLVHDNSGKDLGAYMKAAHTIPADLMLFLGAPIRFRRAGWLDWVVDCYLNNGPGLYGSWGCHAPMPHIRTTGFFCSPELLRAYPYYFTTANRYAVEHGDNSLTLWAEKMGFPVMQVTWKGAFPMKDWHVPTNEDCLYLDQNSDRLAYV